jgi:hypothetical protein
VKNVDNKNYYTYACCNASVPGCLKKKRSAEPMAQPAPEEGIMEIRNASPLLREKIEHSSVEGRARLRARGVQPDPDLFDFSYQNCYSESSEPSADCAVVKTDIDDRQHEHLHVRVLQC